MKGGGVIALDGPPKGIGFHIFSGVRLTPSHKSVHERTVYWISKYKDVRGVEVLVAYPPRHGSFISLGTLRGKWWIIAMPCEHEGETWTDGN